MHYHWELGLGHFHVHQPTSTSRCAHVEPDAQDGQPLEPEDDPMTEERGVNIQVQDGNSDACDSDPELCLEDCEYEGWNDVESEDSEDGGDNLEDMNSEEDD
jgi:hypothetical protein